MPASQMAMAVRMTLTAEWRMFLDVRTRMCIPFVTTPKTQIAKHTHLHLLPALEPSPRVVKKERDTRGRGGRPP